MGGKSGGQSGNVEDAARVQGEEARRLAYEESIMNRPNMNNPWGSTTWTDGGMAQYGDSMAGGGGQSSGSQWTPSRTSGGMGSKWGAAIDRATAGQGGEPSTMDKWDASFYKAPERSTMTETLNPKLQGALDFNSISFRAGLIWPVVD